MPKVTQLAVTLENKPGTLAKVCSTLGKEGVNVLAVFAPEIKGKGKVRLLVDSPDKAKAALSGAKIRFSEEDAIAVSAENKPGALAEIADKLARSKINIKYVYATTSEEPAKATIILAVPNVDKALGVLA
jgi:hypothetical protein